MQFKKTYPLILKTENFLLYATEIKFLTTIIFIISAFFLKFLLSQKGNNKTNNLEEVANLLFKNFKIFCNAF
ncbi:hypothetical protein CV644_04850 [Borreliella burgdorferi]|nr:hypothetical protein CV681_05445 [Borreliella burgdorferi]PRR10911.1 hypothetical protein CV660_05335 [Borreliella burgdorferi]PRR20935.1 hypothetical protein CV644_04850 [Borreliella burgdorferi]PRR62825.1 hypothetical protein CV638_05320 [Borreliella burgdorferi]